LKKIFAASAFLTVLFVILYLAGALDFNNTINKSLTEGSRLYSEEKYSEALASFRNGLLKDPYHKKLNYNAAQASYMLQNYEQAAGYYAKAAEKADTYLNWGNSYFNTGERSEDANEKLQLYIKALETYKQGILKYPQNVELKFNYEFTEKKINELQESMNENQPQDDNNGNREEQRNNGQDSEGGEQDREEQQDGQQDEQSGGSDQNEQQNEQDGQENNNQNNSDSGEQQNSENEQSSGQDDASSEETGSDQQEQGMPGINEADDSKVGEADDMIEQVLRMLEKQEEQALKNNRHIKDYRGEDEYDW